MLTNQKSKVKVSLAKGKNIGDKMHRRYKFTGIVDNPYDHHHHHCQPKNKDKSKKKTNLAYVKMSIKIEESYLKLVEDIELHLHGSGG